MATFQVFTSYDMSNPGGMFADALTGVITQNTATGFTITYSVLGDPLAWVTTVTGTGFTYGVGGQPGVSLFGGTYTTVNASHGGQRVYSLTGASADAGTDGGYAIGAGASELDYWIGASGSITGSAGRDSLTAPAGNHTITGGGGSDRVVFSGPKANYTVTTTATGYTVTDNVGGGGTETLTGITYLKFSDGYDTSAPFVAPPNQTLIGALTSETLSGGFGNDTIDGGGGTDTFAFSGPYANYTIRPDTATHGYIVSDSTGFDGTYTIKNFSTMQFTDQSISFVGQNRTGTAGNDTWTSGHGNDTYNGGGGLDTVDYAGPKANYVVTGDSTTGYTVNDTVGLDGTDTLFGISKLQFTDQSQALALSLTGSGTDTIVSGPGNDTISGGVGTHTVLFSGNRADYTIAKTSTGFTVADTQGRDGTDTISNVSFFKFADQTVPLANQTPHGGPGNETLSGGLGNDTITGGGGLDTVLFSGPKANYVVSGNSNTGYVVTDQVGPDGTDTLFGISKLQFTDQSQTLGLTVTGTTGNQTLNGGPGDDTITGGTGIDTVAYTGNRSDYVVTNTGNGFTVSDSIAGRDGTDTLLNVQRLKFSDQSLAYDTSGDAGQAYRMYQAAFSRTPDSAGLGYWISSMDNGEQLITVAQSFIGSAEFTATYGALNTVDFVAQLYLNVLHRPGEPAGALWWQQQIDAGTFTRPYVLAGFSESAENQANVANVIGNGFSYTPWGA